MEWGQTLVYNNRYLFKTIQCANQICEIKRNKVQISLEKNKKEKGKCPQIKIRFILKQININ